MPARELKMVVHTDTSPFLSALDELVCLFEAFFHGDFDITDLPPDSFGRRINEPSGLFKINTVQRDDLATPGTGHLTIVFEPSDGLTRCLTAARDGDLDRSFFELCDIWQSPVAGEAGPSRDGGPANLAIETTPDEGVCR